MKSLVQGHSGRAAIGTRAGQLQRAGLLDSPFFSVGAFP